LTTRLLRIEINAGGTGALNLTASWNRSARRRTHPTATLHNGTISAQDIREGDFVLVKRWRRYPQIAGWCAKHRHRRGTAYPGVSCVRGPVMREARRWLISNTQKPAQRSKPEAFVSRSHG
jgi:NAD-dependent DNA ligase